MKSVPSDSPLITVIIRTAGERTESLCYEIVSRQAPVSQIHWVREAPFSQALRRGYEIGLHEGRKWTLCLDADVLLIDNALPSVLSVAESLSGECFGMGVMVFDQFYGRKNYRGFHLYRTCLLDRALKRWEHCKDQIRPETAVKNAMKDAGYPWHPLPEVYGIHDYEQYYADIFRKMATRAQKSQREWTYLCNRAESLSRKSPDFLVALWALRFGNSDHSTVAVLNKSQWRDTIQLLMDCYGLKEKSPLEADGMETYVFRQLWRERAIHFLPVNPTGLTPADRLRRLYSRVCYRLSNRERLYKQLRDH